MMNILLLVAVIKIWLSNLRLIIDDHTSLEKASLII